jgi:hypothetical protein
VALQGKVRWSKQRRGSLHSQAFQKRARERRNSAANRTSKTCMCYQAFDPTEYRYRCNHSSKLVPLGPRSAVTSTFELLNHRWHGSCDGNCFLSTPRRRLNATGCLPQGDLRAPRRRQPDMHIQELIRICSSRAIKRRNVGGVPRCGCGCDEHGACIYWKT